ncbi:hypothetical protein N24_2019 [Corynebacterium suranareeae]|uniref:Uncharacterized protein n=1 Tax=Corynebacterium suranareeae TaxID=2506452 RepID=A0A160PTD7_9CORY|nr:hypothetical protein N24_2019 [Corynebacterium suranareeae]
MNAIHQTRRPTNVENVISGSPGLVLCRQGHDQAHDHLKPRAANSYFGTNSTQAGLSAIVMGTELLFGASVNPIQLGILTLIVLITIGHAIKR